MEPIKQLFHTHRVSFKALFICTLLLISGDDLLAQRSGTGSGKITIGEILMYVAIIIVVIAVAWVFASRQSDKGNKEQHGNSGTPKKHYDHPNDPHFRKLRKKTS